MADIYVRATGGNDGHGGTSWADAFATVQVAEAAAGDGDTVWMDGAFSTAAIINYDAGHNGETIVFDGEKGDGPVGSTSISCTASSNYCFLSSITSGSLTLKNFTLTATDSATNGIIRISADGGTMIIDNCSIGDTTASQHGVRVTAAATSLILQIIDTTMNVSECPVYYEGGSLSVTGSNVWSTSSTSLCVYINDNAGNVLIDSLTLTCSGNDGSIASNAAGIDMNDVTQGGTAKVSNCDIIISGNYHRGINIPYYFDTVYVLNNTVNHTAINGASCIQVGVDGIINSTPIKMAVVKGNIITKSDIASGHGLLAGCNYDTTADLDLSGAPANEYLYTYMGKTHISNNIISGGDIQLAGKDCINTTFIGNVVYGSSPVKVKSCIGCVFSNNTVVSTSGTALAIYLADGLPAKYNIVENNIIVNLSAGYTLSLNDAGAALAYINNNCYYRSDGGNIAFVSDAAVTDLEALQAKWDSLANVAFVDNDEFSIEENPLLADAANGDFRLQSNSPCLNTGLGTPNSGYTSFGAWQRKSVITNGQKSAGFL